MRNQREFLVESRDSWQESADHDKKQLLASLAMVATGLTLAGIGIGTIVNGDIGGVLEVAVGGGFAVAFGKMGLSEIKDFADTTAQTSIVVPQNHTTQ